MRRLTNPNAYPVNVTIRNYSTSPTNNPLSSIETTSFTLQPKGGKLELKDEDYDASRDLINPLETSGAITVVYVESEYVSTREVIEQIADEVANNTAEGRGDGENIVLPKEGTKLPFKSVKGAGNVNVSSDPENVIIESDAEANTASNKGGGEVLALPKEGADLPFKSLVAGTNVTLSSDSEKITINAAGTPDTTVNGGVFITDVNPSGSGAVGTKVYEDGVVLTSCISDTELLRVTVMAITGSSHYKPRVTINGIDVTNFSLDDSHQWTGTADIDLDGGTLITTVHEDGPTYSCGVTIQLGPEITALSFTGGYPGSQTELKENDTFDLVLTCDSPCDLIEIQDFEAGTFDQIAVPEGAGPHTITLDIADRGTGTIANQRARVRARNSAGGFGSTRLSDVSGGGDGVAYVQLNNDVPVINITSVDYPATQGAIKASESSTVNHTVSLIAESTIQYTSPGGQITITNPTSYEPAKNVDYLSGDYNISSNNFSITATKVSNNAVSSANTVVKIANIDPVITVSEQYSRLRSSPAGSNYTITLNSTQQLANAPSLNALGVNEGTWVSGFTGGPTVWTRTMQVSDSDTKGTFSYGGLIATNLAGKVVNTISGDGNYTLGGFLFRTLTVAAWPNREVAIGCNVSNTSKLRCTNLSKGASGSLNFTYKGTIGDEVDRYTITDGSQTPDANGTHWYNCDLANAVSNTSGTMQIELEEIV